MIKFIATYAHRFNENNKGFERPLYAENQNEAMIKARKSLGAKLSGFYIVQSVVQEEYA